MEERIDKRLYEAVTIKALNVQVVQVIMAPYYLLSGYL